MNRIGELMGFIVNYTFFGGILMDEMGSKTELLCEACHAEAE